MCGEDDAGRTPDWVICGQRFLGKDINGGPKSSGLKQFGECIEVYEMRVANQNQDCTGLNPFQVSPIEQRLIFGRWNGEHEDNLGGTEQMI